MGKFANIVVEPPGPKAKEIVDVDKKLLMQSFSRYYPLVVKRGRGFIVEDVDGNKYLDFNSGIAVMNIGHCHPKVVEAVRRKVGELLHYSITDFIYEEPSILAAKLVEITPGKWEKKVFYGNSGAEAVEGGIKVARGYFKGSRSYLLAFTGSFHGRTLGALSLTSSKNIQRKYFSPLLPGVIHVPYPYCFRCPWRQEYPHCNFWCVDFIEEWIFEKYVPPEEVAAIFFEPIAGEGGYIVPPRGFWNRIYKLAKRYGILLIDDEVQTGMGRTGKWFAIQHWNVEPDVILIAKALASGLPLSAIVGRAEVMNLPRGSHASTFGGNPVSCTAAIETIRIIEEEGLLGNAERVGSYLLKRLNELKEKYREIGDVRGLGLMIGVEIVDRDMRPDRDLAVRIIREAFKRGLLLITGGISVIRLAPPLTITEEAVDEGMSIFEDALKVALRLG
ncbi:MAG: aspartate aminotransferase family protein [Thermofilum sp. ex4484_15]|nr:MAG: aspartate aminotransferase family protein [Thermofilum sp. ex4484_15]